MSMSVKPMHSDSPALGIDTGLDCTLVSPQLERWDRLGIWISSVCALHCVATPLALALIPMVGLRLGEYAEVFHVLVALTLLPTAFFAFLRGFRHHHDRMTIGLGILGVVILMLAIALHEIWGNPLLHTAVNLIGSLLLISGHLRNRRMCGRCDH